MRVVHSTSSDARDFIFMVITRYGDDWHIGVWPMCSCTFIPALGQSFVALRGSCPWVLGWPRRLRVKARFVKGLMQVISFILFYRTAFPGVGFIAASQHRVHRSLIACGLALGEPSIVGVAHLAVDHVDLCLLEPDLLPQHCDLLLGH